jgi:hypothetical protein
MDDDFEVDLDEVKTNIAEAEVISLFFPMLRSALVIDTRRNETDGPMLRIMPMAASPQERLRSIRRLRPGFPRLQSLTLIPWSRYVNSLVEIGIWDMLVKRFKDSSQEKAIADCEKILEDLRRLEKAELSSVVLGENYHTIWSSRG